MEQSCNLTSPIHKWETYARIYTIHMPATTEPVFTILIRAHLLYSLKSWREELGSGMKRKYPRATLRRIMKNKRNINISKSADLAVSSSYFFFYTARAGKNRSFVSIAGPATS